MSDDRLPNLLIAGVPKAGTSALFDYLTQHPEICRGDQKEVGYLNYFNPERYSRPPPPLNDYTKHFTKCGRAQYAVDATPTYSYGGGHLVTAAREVLKEPKIVITLRNPTDRLWSAYTFQRSLGHLAHLGSFESYLDTCERRWQEGIRLAPGDHLHGLAIGFYENYIGLWLKEFDEDMRIVFAERLSRDPAAVTSQIFLWLGLGPDLSQSFDFGRRNVTHVPRHLRVAKAAYQMKASVKGWDALPTQVRQPIQQVYRRLNAGARPAQMSPSLRRRVDNIYAASNRATAKILASYGYADMPTWLDQSGTAVHKASASG